MKFRKSDVNMQMRVMRRLWWDRTMSVNDIAALWGVRQPTVAYTLGMFRVIVSATGGLLHQRQGKDFARSRFYGAGKVLA